MANPRHGVLVTDTVTVLTLDENYRKVELSNRGTADIFYLLDAPTGGGTPVPVVEGNGSEVLPAGTTRVVKSTASAVTTVKLKATGTPKYTVKGLPGY